MGQSSTGITDENEMESQRDCTAYYWNPFLGIDGIRNDCFIIAEGSCFNPYIFKHIEHYDAYPLHQPVFSIKPNLTHRS
jgi:hypothetical protein